MDQGIEQRASFDRVRYANCWEDAHVLCEALRPLSGLRVLSIASGGDNSLALAAEGAEVVAADLSPAQIALVELRRAAFRHLDHGGVLRFLGVHPEPRRREVYERLERDLSPEARAFWRRSPGAIAEGIIHMGRFERYFRFFRSWVLPLVHNRSVVSRLVEAKDEKERLRFYEAVWDRPLWRLLFRIFFSRPVMGRMGRDPEFFRYVEGPVADRILSRVRHALTVLPTHANPFLEYILTGNFRKALPRYLEPTRFDAVRKGVERLTLFRGPVEEAARRHGEHGFDRFNLSDIFEYMDSDAGDRVYRTLIGFARRGARLAYWNMLVPRRRPDDVAGRIRSLTELSEELFRRDLAFFYSAFIVEEVR